MPSAPNSIRCCRGFSPLKSLLALVGIGRDPFSLTPEERVLEAYYERFTAYAVDKSRVIVVDFQSRDPELAARVANSIAEGYLVLQQDARQQQAKSAGQWLSGEIEHLRKKVAEAESRVEDFRSKSSLFVGTNNTTLSNQQMGEINTQLNNARALKSDAESKARLIKEMLQSGKPIEASEVLNSELVRRLSEQRVTLRAQLAEQSSTLLDGHPRIKELKAQLADIDRQLREEASKISRSLESDARLAVGRVDGLMNEPRPVEEAGFLQQRPGRAAPRARARSQGAARSARILSGEIPRGEHPREYRGGAGRRPHHLARHRFQHPGLSEEAADRADRDAGDLAAHLRRDCDRRAVAHDRAAGRRCGFAGSCARNCARNRLGFSAGTGARAGDRARASRGGPSSKRIDVSEPVLNEPRVDSPRMDTAAEIGEIEQVADVLVGAGAAARKVTVLGTASSESITLTALTLARLMAQQAKVVVVDLVASSPTIPAVSVDPVAPGLAELMQGEASFAQIITRDRLSRVHLVSAGRPGFDRAQLQSPRLTLAIDALLRVYDHVLLDAGTASDLPAELLTSQARAVVVPEASMAPDARALMCDQLRAVGFSEVTMLSKPCQASDAVEPGPRVVAA